METSERLKNLIARFVLKYNYWGFLFSRIRQKPSNKLTSIMGVGPESDGTITLYYNPEKVAKTDDHNLTLVISHEGFHLLNKHIPRLLRILANEPLESNKNKKVKIWNYAADCCVNQQANLDTIIIDNKTIELVTPKRLDLPENQISEKYYLDLLKQTEDNSNGSGCGENGEGEGMFGPSAGQLPDDHDWTKNIKGVADLSSLSRKVDQHVQNIIRESVKSFNKERGTLPANIAELIESALAPPKAPYYQIIRKLVKGSRYTKFKRSPTKINRKRTYSFVIGRDDGLPEISPFPGKTRDMTFDIVVMIDTSGSMSQDDVLEGLSGVKNIIENDRHCYTTVLEVDASVEKEYEVKHVRDIEFNIKGRGGTTLRPGLERARELGCDVCLAFTDGFVEDINSIPRKALPKRTIWVITKNGTSKHVNKTGFVVHI